MKDKQEDESCRVLFTPGISNPVRILRLLESMGVPGPVAEEAAELKTVTFRASLTVIEKCWKEMREPAVGTLKILPDEFSHVSLPRSA